MYHVNVYSRSVGTGDLVRFRFRSNIPTLAEAVLARDSALLTLRSDGSPLWADVRIRAARAR
jgi:hypothetical protein